MRPHTLSFLPSPRPRPLAVLVMAVALVLAGTMLEPSLAVGGRIHGIHLSTHGGGADWAGDGVPAAFDRMRSVGTDWIAFHPYARIEDDGGVSFHRFDPEDPPRWITRPIEEAHARGMKVLVKPHLAHWGSRFDWRGAIRFDDPLERERFFREYGEWIRALAVACRDADAFSVGTELDGTVELEASWRQLVTAVRASTDLPLTYAANWSDYQKVPFWDALDVIGIQAYFPLSDRLPPTEQDLRGGWRSVLDAVSEYARSRDRHVVFTELGYNHSWSTAATPWAHETDGPAAEVLQALCLRVALEEIEKEPRVIGSFLWKWFPEPRPNGRDFRLATPRIMGTIASVWSRGTASVEP